MNISDLAAWFTNVATSVCIIFVNKLLMGSQGYLFNFAVTLSGLHYLAAALLMQTYSCSGLMSANGTMPWKDRLIFVAVASMSIISLNVSLLLNNVRTTSAFLLVQSLLTVSHERWTVYGLAFAGRPRQVLGVAIVRTTASAILVRPMGSAKPSHIFQESAVSSYDVMYGQEVACA